jgi:aryl-alcohol dehydrogenase-like predicted oxidoreductase
VTERVGGEDVQPPVEHDTGAGSDDAESIRTIHRALELGVTLDTAEVYGPYTNEELVGRALKGRRDQVAVATKFGMISHTGRNGLDSGPANIRTAIDGSLRRLDTDRVDLYYQHRVDPGTPIEDTVGTLAELVGEGKIRHIGLSEAIAWLLSKGDDIVPIPGTKRVSRVEENAADGLELTAEQVAELDSLTPPGEWHWHGAAADHFMTHLAMWEGPGEDNGPESDWGDHVTDEEYDTAPRSVR